MKTDDTKAWPASCTCWARGAAIAASVENRNVAVLTTATDRFTVPLALLSKAASAGLVRRSGGHILVTPETKMFLRRRGEVQDEFAGQHRDLAFEIRSRDGAEQTVCVNRSEPPLNALERLKGKGGERYFPAESIAAGERLFADFTRGQMPPRVTMSFEPRLTHRSRARVAVSPTSRTVPLPHGFALLAQSMPWGRSFPAWRWMFAAS